MIVDAATPKRILVVDPNGSQATRLKRELPADQYSIFSPANARQARVLVKKQEFDLALIDAELADTDPMDLLYVIKKEHPSTVVVMMTQYGEEEMWVEVLSKGASDLVEKPVSARDIEARFRRQTRSGAPARSAQAAS